MTLSLSETQAIASVFSIPASLRSSVLNPLPAMVIPLKPGPSLENADGFLSTTTTLWPSFERSKASSEPTLPQPIMMTYILKNYKLKIKKILSKIQTKK